MENNTSGRRAGAALAATALLIVVIVVTVVFSPLGAKLESQKLSHRLSGVGIQSASMNSSLAKAVPVYLNTAKGYDAIFANIVNLLGYSSEEEMQETYRLREEQAAADKSFDDEYLANGYTGESVESAPPADAPGLAGATVADNAIQAAPKPDFSDTNNQTEGVQEADLIKSDGKYIYTLNSEKLNIVKANGLSPKLVGSITQNTSRIYTEMLITEERLIAIGNGASDKATGSDMITGIDIFDISDKSKPRKLNSLTQSGSYTSSRLIGDSLYLISDYGSVYLRGGNISKGDPSTYVPVYTEDGEESSALPEEIIMPPNADSPNYTLVSGIDISGKGRFVSKKSMYGDVPDVYVSEANIYIAGYRFKSDKKKTVKYALYTETGETIFTRFSIKDGKVNLEASGQIPGCVLNQFSMDEYKGAFRAVMTESKYQYKEYYEDYVDEPQSYEDSIGSEVRTNAIYVFDMDMKVIGSITGLAEDESVYSARFMGGYAYFVTFLETDPLFCVDLRNAKNPRIVSALKIPGFSNYLHPYKDGLLFGIGEERSEDGSQFEGIKLSMFDTSNPTDVKEKSKKVLAEYYSTPIAENHKAILVNSEKSLVAFPADNSYVICRYSKEGFSVVKSISSDNMTGESDTDFLLGDFNGEGLRGMFIGDCFYVISPQIMTVFDMKNDFIRAGSLRLGSEKAVAPSLYGYTSTEICY